MDVQYFCIYNVQEKVHVDALRSFATISDKPSLNYTKYLFCIIIYYIFSLAMPSCFYSILFILYQWQNSSDILKQIKKEPYKSYAFNKR